MHSMLRSLTVLTLLLGPAAGCADVQAEPSSAVGSTRNVDVDQLDKDRQNGTAAVLIDVRTPAEFARGHVPGAKNIPLDQIGSKVGDLPDDQEIYLVCQSGARSARAAALLSAQGLQTVNVTGGTAAWQRAGKAVE